MGIDRHKADDHKKGMGSLWIVSGYLAKFTCINKYFFFDGIYPQSNFGDI